MGFGTHDKIQVGVWIDPAPGLPGVKIMRNLLFFNPLKIAKFSVDHARQVPCHDSLGAYPMGYGLRSATTPHVTVSPGMQPKVYHASMLDVL